MSELKPLYAQFLREKQYLSGFSPTTIKLFGWTLWLGGSGWGVPYQK
jgi:hypothetical protein